MAITLNNLDGTANVNEFVQNYRDALQQSYDASVANIENQKTLDEASIMSNANTRGMMYSNFPQRDKIKYQANTYLPNLVSARNTYQTGIDSLRNKGVDIMNNISNIEKAIQDLNAYNFSAWYPNK